VGSVKGYCLGLVELRISALETHRLGVRVGRVEAVTGADVPEMLDWARGEAVEFLVVRTDAADVEAALALMAISALCASSEIHYKGTTDPRPFPSTCEISPVVPSEREAVIALATAAFRAYPSHYRMSTRLDPERVEATYSNWAENCLDNQAAELTLVARSAGKIVGFSSFARIDTGGVRLVLGAVDPAARGQHVYTQLTLAGMGWAHDRGLRWILAITQVGNIPAQRSWVAAGLSPDSATNTYHLWLP
jgi:ribosomal protein S18 acetylase RimI-like enzyme